MAREKYGIMAMRSGLTAALLLMAALIFLAGADVVLAESVPDGGTIQATQTTNGTWGPGVISATNNVVINTGVVITIAPNTTIRVSNNRGFTVNGNLHTEGPVVFTGVSGTPGAWTGVTYAFWGNGSLDGVTIEYAQHALTLNALNSITVANSTLRYNRHATTGSQDAFGAGLRIQRGNPLIEATRIYSNTVMAAGSGGVFGAGIYIEDGSPRIVDSWIYENTATGSREGVGGGIAIAEGEPVIESSSITTNTLAGSGDVELKSGGGIGFMDDSDAEIRGCWIAGNRVDLTGGYAGGGGIGFVSEAAAAVIEQNVIYANYVEGSGWCEGGGIDAWERNAVWVRNNLIIGNTGGTCGGGYYGGGMNLNAGGTGLHVINNTIVGNQSQNAGGLYLQSGTISVLNNVVANNTATVSDQVGGIAQNAGTANYNDVWGNSTPQTSGTMGSQTLYVAPVFLGTGDLAEQYHLGQTSPLIDVGTNSGTGLPTDDYDGDGRPLGGGWDMGFDETSPLLVSKSVDHDPVAAGDVLTYTILASNIGQIDATSVTLFDPLPLHTIYVPGSSLITLPDYTGTYRDTLASVAYNGSDGTLEWSSQPWSEISDNNNPNTGDVRVTSDSGDYSIRITNNGNGASRLADLSGSMSATLSFEYRRREFDGGSDSVALQLSDNGGSSWDTVATYSRTGTDNNYLSASYDISEYIASNTMIRFLSSGLTNNGDYFYVDNVQIAADFQPAPIAGGTPPNLASVATLLAGQQMTVTYAVEVDHPLAGGTQFTNTASVTSAEVASGWESSVTSTVINDPPVAVDDSGTTDEDTVLNVSASGVLSNDTDPDGSDTLTVTGYDATSVEGATVTVNGDGSYSYDPAGVAAFQALAVGESASDSFTYTIGDGNGGSDTATVAITVTGVNDGPTAVNDSGTTDEDTVLNAPASGVLSNDTDPDDSDTLSVTGYDAISVAGAAVTVNADGSYSYDPTGVAAFQALAVGESASDSFTYTIGDGNGGSDTATVSITVTGVNDGPTATDDTGSTDEDTVLNVAASGVLGNDADPDDSDTLTVTTYDATSVEGAAVTVNADGSYSYDPTGVAAFQALAVGQSASDSFTYTIGDGNGGSDTATVAITVNGVNDGPTAVNDSGTTDEDTVLNEAAPGVLDNDTDPDGSDTLTVTAYDATSVEGATVTVNADGSYSYDPTGVAAFQALAVGESASDSFTYTIGDGNGGSDTATVAITVTGVNDGPTAVDDSDTTDEDTVLNVAASGVLSNDTDPDGSDTLTVTGYDATSAQGAIVTVNADGSYSYDPTGVAAFQALAVGESASDSFTYTIGDGNGGSDTATVSITVMGVNDGPTAVNDSGTTDEDTVLNEAAPGVLDNDTDPDGSDTLTVTGYDATSAQGAIVTVNADGSYSYDPTGVAAFQALAIGETAMDSFTYTIGDGNGGSDTATVSITVTGVNDGPTAVNDSGTTDEDTVLNVAASGVLSNDTDPDGSDTLTVTGYDATSAQGAIVTVNADGSYSYDPTGVAAFQALAIGETAMDSFTYTIGDGNGGSDTATVSITVNGVNDGPTAVDDSGTTDEDTVLNEAAPGVLNNDTDPDGSDTLTVTAYDTTSVEGAAVTVNADGSYSYDPTGVAAFQALAVGESASDSFTYTIGDGNGGSDTATVAITVNGVNDGPTAVNDSGTTDEDTVLNEAAPGVLDNDTDPDGSDTLTVTGYDATSAQGAIVTVNADGSYSYDPTGVAAFQALAIGETAMDSFTYTIGDGNGGSDTATVSITVTGVNDGPTAVNDSGTTDEDTVLNVAASGVLGNDTDPDGSDTLTVTGYDATSAQGAIVTVNADGSYSYDPTGVAAFQALAVGESASDSFTYTIGDGNGGSDTATVAITVTGVNDGPTAVDDSDTTDEDTVLNVAASGVLSNDTDPDGSDTLTVTAYDTTSVEGAAVTVNADGSYSYDPTGVAAFQVLAVGESASDSFTYTIGDGNGGSDTATVAITVNGVNDGPTAVNDADSTNADIVLTVSQPGVLGNDTDPDGSDTLSVTGYDATGTQGAVVVNADGSYSYDPTGVAAFQALAAGETATDSFTYAMGDGSGGSDTATVTITVWGVNGSPTAADDSGATDEDTVLTVAASGVLGNDTDPDDSDILTVTGYDAGSVQGAVVVVNADGGYSYDPTGAAALQAIGEGGTVVDSFTYTADDGNGGTDVATVSIIVTGRNDAPTVGDQAFNVAENCPDDTVVGTVGATEMDSGDALTYTIVAGDPEALFTLDSTTGVLTVNDGSKLDFETTPTYVLTVRVTDRGFLTDTAAITVNVDDAVYAPVLEMVKEGPETADAGEVVTYTFTISHAVSSDGTPVNAVEVADSIAGTAGYVSGDADGDGFLDADETWIYVVTYTVQADDPSPLINEGTVTAKDLDGNTVSATASHSTAISEYTLDVVVVGSGTVTKDPDRVTYRYGDVVTLTATAAPGWGFVEWTGDVTGTLAVTIVPIDGNKSVTATFVDVPAGIAVSVSADPATVHEPGEMVTYTVRVDNTSAADGVTLTGLTDDVHGDLNGQGSCAVPQSIAAGGFYECSLTAWVSGVKGEVKTAMVTASGVDEDGNPVGHSDEVSVGVVPKIPAIGDYVLFMPLVMRNHAPVVTASNLVVEQITVVEDALQIVIKNAGDAAVTDSFWVDLYVNPVPAPTAVNQIWELLATQGAVWGVEGAVLPLEPGETLTLQVGGDYYWPELSRLPGSLAAGTTVYVQVDSANTETTYGAVFEGHERTGGAYDNISNLTLPSTVTVMEQSSESDSTVTEQPRTGSSLPLRR